MSRVYGLAEVAQLVCQREQQLDTVAVLLRTLFCQEMQRRGVTDYGNTVSVFDGHSETTRFGRRSQPSVWFQAADHLRQNRLDPLVMVMCTFATAEEYPTAKDMSKLRLITQSQDYVRQLPERVTAGYKSASRSAQTRISELSSIARLTDTDIITSVVGDTSQVAACSLFRYCLAYHSGLQIACANWSAYAYAELLMSPLTYQRCWPANWIPQAMLQAAFGGRQQLANYIPGGLDPL